MTGNTDGNQPSSGPGNEEGYELWRLPEATPSANPTIRTPNTRSSPPFQQSTRSMLTSTAAQQRQRVDLFDPHLLPLPPSSAGTSFLDPGSSLEALEAGLLSSASRITQDRLLFTNAGVRSASEVVPTDHASPSDAHPERIPLPSSGVNSIEPSLNELLAHTTPHDKQSQTVASPSLTYMSYVDQISEHLPHLTNMRSASRRDYARVTIFDYSGSTLDSFRELHVDFGARRDRFNKYDDLRSSVCGGFLPNIDTRLLVVEDLGLSLIDLLGSTFDIVPEFFAEHLHRSGYHSGKENEHPPQTWSTSNMRKNYISLKWYRPVTRWGQEPNSLEQRRVLLDTRDTTRGFLEGSYDVVHTVGNKEGSVSTVDYTINALTNIFRPEWAMSTEPDGIIPLTAPSGWEERATACTVTLEGHRYSSSS